MKTNVEALRMKTQAAALVAEKLGFMLGVASFFLVYMKYESVVFGMIAYFIAYYASTKPYDNDYNNALKMNDPEDRQYECID